MATWQHGNMAMMFGLMLVPLIFAMGAAVDYSRAAQSKVQFQTALDATALAIGLMPANVPQGDMEAEVFNANFDGGNNWGSGIVVSKVDGIIDLTLANNINTFFWGSLISIPWT